MKIITAIILSGLCYYFGNGLNGDFFYLVWLAPVPVIYLALIRSPRIAFIVSFLAYLTGRLSWFGYLVKVATILPAVIFTIVPALIFAGIIVLTRSVSLKLNAWYSIFVFPLLFTSFEYVLIKCSADGTAISIAYSQMNFLPIIQIASVAGILGITFILTLIPSSIAGALFFRKEKKQLIYVLTCSGIIISSVFIFGLIRLNHVSTGNEVKVGLLVMEEEGHNDSNKPNSMQDSAALAFYLRQIDSLAYQHVSVVLLPERALSIENEVTITALKHAARKNNVCIISGYTNLRGTTMYNSAIVINNEGSILADYNKVHLVTGLERQFSRGKNPGLFTLNNLQAGIAICKDLDFQDYIRQYGDNKPNVLFVPAWDFVVDDWLHSRMAILRSVENGFSQVRTARAGALTISDCYGRVIQESSCSNLQSAALTGAVPTERLDTFYTRFGDWPGILSLVLSAFLIILAYSHRFDFKRLSVSGEIPR